MVKACYKAKLLKTWNFSHVGTSPESVTNEVSSFKASRPEFHSLEQGLVNYSLQANSGLPSVFVFIDF